MVRLTLDEKPSKYRFELNETFGRFDDRTKRILDESPLDGLAASAWLGPDVLHRDRRKACLMKILAKLRVVPSIAKPLSTHVRRILVVEDNRVYAEVEPDFFGAYIRECRVRQLPHTVLERRTAQRPTFALRRRLPRPPRC